MGKILIIIGLVLILAGIILHYFPNVFQWLGRLPGDVNYSKDGFSLHIPIVTSLIISLIISLFIWLLKRFS